MVAELRVPALNGPAKLVFHNMRPTLWISPAPEDGYGFPSGHAMGSMALLAALVSLAWSKRWRRPAGIVGGLVVHERQTAVGQTKLAWRCRVHRHGGSATF